MSFLSLYEVTSGALIKVCPLLLFFISRNDRNVWEQRLAFDFGDRQEILILTLHTSELYDCSCVCLVDVLSLLSQSTNLFFSYLLSVIVIPPFLFLYLFSCLIYLLVFLFSFFILLISSHIFTFNIFIYFLKNFLIV